MLRNEKRKIEREPPSLRRHYPDQVRRVYSQLTAIGSRHPGESVFSLIFELNIAKIDCF